jgi:hypothetical protein
MLIKLTPYQDKGQGYIDNHIIDQDIMRYGIISHGISKNITNLSGERENSYYLNYIDYCYFV